MTVAPYSCETVELSFLPKGQQVICNEIFQIICDNYKSNKTAEKGLIDKLVSQLVAHHKNYAHYILWVINMGGLVFITH